MCWCLASSGSSTSWLCVHNPEHPRCSASAWMQPVEHFWAGLVLSLDVKLLGYARIPGLVSGSLLAAEASNLGSPKQNCSMVAKFKMV